MRSRERARIEKNKRELRLAKRRLAYHARKNRDALPEDESRAVLRAQMRAYRSVAGAQAKLAQAILAPARARSRDVGMRPDRYADPASAKRRALAAVERAQKIAAKITGPRLSGRESAAQKYLAQAYAQGRDLDDVYREIAARTGLSAVDVYTMGLYLSTDSTTMPGEIAM